MQNEDDPVHGKPYHLKDEIIINGIRTNAVGLMSIFMMVFAPDPTKWYRFEKKGEYVMCEMSSGEESIQ